MLLSKLSSFQMKTRLPALIALLSLSAIVTVAAPTVTAVARPHETTIRFARHSHKVLLIGRLSTSHPERTYRLMAKKGQHLKIDLLSLGGENGLVAMYHITFPSGKQFGEKGYDPFDGMLTETGTYHISVDVNQMASNSTSGKYRLILSR